VKFKIGVHLLWWTYQQILYYYCYYQISTTNNTKYEWPTLTKMDHVKMRKKKVFSYESYSALEIG